MVLLTITAAADRLGFTAVQLRNMCRRGSIPVITIPAGKDSERNRYFIEEGVINKLVPKETTLIGEKIIEEEGKTQNIIQELRIAVSGMKRSNEEFKTTCFRELRDNTEKTQPFDTDTLVKNQNRIYERFSMIDNQISNMNQKLDKILSLVEAKTYNKDTSIILTPPTPKPKRGPVSDNPLAKFGGD